MTANETAPTEERIRDYLAEQLPDAADLRLADVEQIAVGWSHETWLFDARWNDGDATRAQGFCLRRDPGNALLRELSDLGRAVPRAAVPRAHGRPDAEAVLVRGRPRHPRRVRSS